jgi:lysophospholipase
VADSLPIGSNLSHPPLSQIVYEVSLAASSCKLIMSDWFHQITPLEFGSWDPNLSSMVNITFVGTNLTNGKPDNGDSCVTGFDQAGFVMGTSASLFNVRQCMDT